MNPPWEQDFSETDLINYKISEKELADKWGVDKIDIGRKYKINRKIVCYENCEFEDTLVEITPEEKNKMILTRSNPFRNNKLLDSSGKEVDQGPLTTVLLDPCETQSILELGKMGHSVNSLILEKRLIITNDYMTDRKSPSSEIKIIPVKWR